ncbi:MAG: Holliday junction resolvase [Peptococcaceae bacterium BICA1-7]|nr:MAG: Holliday junction resolvase [Peptococcaceae bacterium BICA1-7]HBV95728.1 Holliday junction resolvase RuvX [Desulfotomaculum sp.]
MRIMGLDLGDKTIGVAVSDPMGWTAQSIEVIRRQGSIDVEIRRLGELITEYGVELILLGLPKNMNGTVGDQGQKAIQYAGQLEERLGLPVQLWDERLSTAAAGRALLEADMSRAKRKKVIDKVAAAVILQGYLDYRGK